MSLANIGSRISTQSRPNQKLHATNNSLTDKKVYFLVIGLGLISVVASIALHSVFPIGFFLVGACVWYVSTNNIPAPSSPSVLPTQQVAQRVIRPNPTDTQGANQKTMTPPPSVNKVKERRVVEKKGEKTPATGFQKAVETKGAKQKTVVPSPSVNEGKDTMINLRVPSFVAATPSEHISDQEAIDPRSPVPSPTSSKSQKKKRDKQICILPGETGLSVENAKTWRPLRPDLTDIQSAIMPVPPNVNEEKERRIVAIKGLETPATTFQKPIETKGAKQKTMISSPSVNEGKDTMINLRVPSSIPTTSSEHMSDQEVIDPRSPVPSPSSSKSQKKKKKKQIYILPGETGLSAANSKRWKVVRKLLKNKANPDQVDPKNGETLLMKAASRGNKATVKLLLDKQANVTTMDSLGETALMKAVKGGHIGVTELILEKDSSPLSQVNNEEQSIMDLAGKSGKIALVISLFAKRVSAS